MTTRDLAHRFFHHPNERGEYARLNTSFRYENWRGERDWSYYSYSTRIGEIKKDKKGNNILIVSDLSYSTKTRKHLNELIHACPFDHIYVPMLDTGYGHWDMSMFYDFERQFEFIQEKTEKDLRRQDERKRVERVCELFDKYVERMGDVPAKAKRLRNSAKVKRALEMARQKDAELVERQRKSSLVSPEVREANRIKREEAIKRRFDRFMANEDVLGKLKLAYTTSYYGRSRYHYGPQTITQEMRNAISDYRTSLERTFDEMGRHQSYMWIDGVVVATSQGIRVPANEVERYCRIWASGHKIIGGCIDGWHIVESTPDHVKVGCHIIPVWNIKAMCQHFKIAC